MCHLILSLPVLGISVFWIFPLQVAIPLYIIILIISAVMYRAIMKSMRMPVRTGSEGLIGEIGSYSGPGSEGDVVSVHGELWNASSPDHLKLGEKIRVTGVNGLHLYVESINRKHNNSNF